MELKRDNKSNQGVVIKLAILTTTLAIMTGCSTSSELCDTFGPSQQATMQIPASASTEAIFACIESETTGNASTGDMYDKGYAIRDSQSGVLETTHYTSKNAGGFRLRADVSRQKSTLSLTLRGAGAYCADLGVREEISRLTSALSRCIKP